VIRICGLKGLLAILITLTVCLDVNPAAAAPDAATEEGGETFGVGVSGGLVSGSGFSVRMLPMDGWGYQAGGIYLRSDDLTFTSLGLEALYIMKRTRRTALYAVGGVSYYYTRTDEDDGYNDSLYNWHSVPVRRRTEEVGVGAGIGVTLRLGEWDQLWLSADMMLTAYGGNVLPYPQGAIHYYFK